MKGKFVAKFIFLQQTPPGIELTHVMKDMENCQIFNLKI